LLRLAGVMLGTFRRPTPARVSMFGYLSFRVLHPDSHGFVAGFSSTARRSSFFSATYHTRPVLRTSRESSSLLSPPLPHRTPTRSCFPSAGTAFFFYNLIRESLSLLFHGSGTVPSFCCGRARLWVTPPPFRSGPALNLVFRSVYFSLAFHSPQSAFSWLRRCFFSSGCQWPDNSLCLFFLPSLFLGG